MLKFEIPDWNI